MILMNIIIPPNHNNPRDHVGTHDCIPKSKMKLCVGIRVGGIKYLPIV